MCAGHDGSTNSGHLAQLGLKFWTRHMLNMRLWAKNLILKKTNTQTTTTTKKCLIFLGDSFPMSKIGSIISTTKEHLRMKGIST